MFTEQNVRKKVETVALQLLRFKIIALESTGEKLVQADKIWDPYTNVYFSQSGKKSFTFYKVASEFRHVISL